MSDRFSDRGMARDPRYSHNDSGSSGRDERPAHLRFGKREGAGSNDNLSAQRQGGDSAAPPPASNRFSRPPREEGEGGGDEDRPRDSQREERRPYGGDAPVSHECTQLSSLKRVAFYSAH
jgi:hypothetical protein